MNIKATSKYQLNDFKKSLSTYYLVILLIIVFITVVDRIFGSNGSGNYNGFEFATVVFLFICGLNSFKDTFLMMLQNGVSRKSMFIGSSITFLSVSVLMTILDRAIASFGNLISNAIGGLSYTGFYDIIYSHRKLELNGLSYQLEALFITWMIYAAAVIVGYFITTLYYRMNKALKIIVSAGVPVTILFILPLLDSMVLGGKISVGVIKFFEFTFGSPGGKANPYNMLIVCIITIIAALLFSWLLVKRAVDKN